jgi:hypothetical protein
MLNININVDIVPDKNMEKRLGKIESVRFGHGGYQDACIGLSVTLGDGSWGVGDFKGTWDPEMIKCSEHSKWTEEDRTNNISESVRFVSKLLKQAKVNSVDKLKGVPIEAIFDGNMLKEWRILTEVL